MEDHNLETYYDFISKCYLKTVDSVCLYHTHHILPKCMGGVDSDCNLIKLSPEDHYNAHLILANCFPDGHKFRAKNLSACRIICKGIRHYLRNITGTDIIESDLTFWNNANKILNTSIRGQNHPSFGIKLTVEQRKNMSEARKGEHNHFYGKIHKIESKDRISKANAGNKYAVGSIRSEETKKKLSIKQKEYQSQQPKIILPNGVYYCDEIIDGKKKTVYRHCPLCDKKLYHLLRADAVRFHNKKMPCYECAMVIQRNKNEALKNGR